MLSIQKFVFNPFSENTYILWDDDSHESAVIDPGFYDPFEQKTFSDFISNKKLDMRLLINTHCHIDHILGCNFVKENYKVRYFTPEADIPLLKHARRQGEMFGVDIEDPVMPDDYLEENKILKVGNYEIKSLFTPGHTPGEYCLYLPDAGICITGDVLFNGSIGRTDLWGGDFNTLIISIREKLLPLPGDTVIYPGHGDSSTIKQEKNHNPFLAE